MKAKSNLFILFFLCIFLLVGCAPQKKYAWYRAATTKEEFMKDKFDCDLIAQNYYNQTMQSAPRGNPPPYSSGPMTSGKGMQRLGDSMMDIGIMEQAKENSKKIFMECLQSRGYVLREKPDGPPPPK
jgi:hypothetical protein